MKKLRILIDIDNTIADTLPHWLKHINNDIGLRVRIEDITDYDLSKCPPLDKLKTEYIFGVLQKPGFTTSIEVMEGAASVLKNLMNDGHEVYLVTARSEAQHITETFQWVKDNLPFIDIRPRARILEALTAAEHFSGGVRRPFNIVVTPLASVPNLL